MATISELRTALATNLATIPGLRTSAYVPDDPNPPIAIIEPSAIDFDTTFGRGLDTLTFSVNVLVGRVSDRTAQASLDAYCSSQGTYSVKTAVESDRTLNGHASDCRVTRLSSYGQVTVGDTIYLAAEFAVQVYAN
jgi:hypothetical protein